MQTFFRIISLYDLLEFLELLMVTNASNSLNILVDMGLGHEKNVYFVRYHLYRFFLKDCY